MLGLEPRTHGLKGRCSASPTPDNVTTCEKHKSDYAKSLAIVRQEHPDLAEVIDAWPRLPAHVAQTIRAMLAVVDGHASSEDIVERNASC